MVIWIIVAAQVANLGPIESEAEAFKPYRECIIRAAQSMLPSNEYAITIEAAARSQCRAEEGAFGAIIAIHGSLSEIAKSQHDASSPYFDHDSSQHYESLNRQLFEDVAYLVVSDRLSRTDNAKKP
jgi:hypothetical protein